MPGEVPKAATQAQPDFKCEGRGGFGESFGRIYAIMFGVYQVYEEGSPLTYCSSKLRSKSSMICHLMLPKGQPIPYKGYLTSIRCSRGSKELTVSIAPLISMWRKKPPLSKKHNRKDSTQY
jgi:hypothetical protein